MTEGGRSIGDLDAVDLAILRHLQDQGRVPNTRIARALGLSEPTVRKRIDRLTQDEIVRVVAVINPSKAGYDSPVILGLKVAPRSIRQVSEELAGHEHCVYLAHTAGRFDLVAEMLFKDNGQLLRFLGESLGGLDGVLDVEVMPVIHGRRINYDWRLPPTL